MVFKKNYGNIQNGEDIDTLSFLLELPEDYFGSNLSSKGSRYVNDQL